MPEANEFATFCAAAGTFWRTNTLPAGEPLIIVEAMAQDLRVTMRNLTVANALRRFIPSRIVVLTGADEEWLGTIWKSFDVSRIERLSRAYGAADVVDIHGLVDRLLAEQPPQSFTIAGRPFSSMDLQSQIPQAELEIVTHATAARTYRTARIPRDQWNTARYRRIHRRSEMFSKVYDTAFRELNPLALITSHLDYSHWGLAVSAAMRVDIPIVHVQTTGTLKGYALFPETRRGGLTFRGEMTKQVGAYFERNVWPHHLELRRSSELTAWRNKRNLGRPTWWRRGDASRIEVRSAGDRRSVRGLAMKGFGLEEGKPVVAVFNHAVSDALHTNVEIFEDLGDWLSRTVEFAAQRTDVNWLVIDHPSQMLYDREDFFGHMADRYASHRHMRFLNNADVSKNVVWSVVDLGLTVRGSISSELPAYGIPAIQAGWSEWSELGFSAVADDAEHYWRLIGDSIDALKLGRPLLDDAQVEKARLWMWFYRSATDVASLLLQPWDLGEGNALYRSLRTTMQQVESDGDPVFDAVRRMWVRREPCITRFDLSDEDLLADLPSAMDDFARNGHEGAEEANGPRLSTLFDLPIESMTLPGRLHAGGDSALQVADGFIRGVSVLGRFSRSPACIGIKLKSPPWTDAPIRVTMTLSINESASSWWEHWVPSEFQPRTPGLPRLLSVRAQGRERAIALLGFASGTSRCSVSFDLERHEVSADGLLLVEVAGLRDDLPKWAADAVAAHGTVGVVLRDLDFAAPGASDPGQVEDRETTSMPSCNGLFLVNPVPDGLPPPTWRLRPIPTPSPHHEAPATAMEAESTTSLLGAMVEQGAVRATAVLLPSGEERSLGLSQRDDVIEVFADAALKEPALVGIEIDEPPPSLRSAFIDWHLVR